MAKQTYTLFDDFELKGIWWLPEKEDLQISGILKFENEKKISLELLGSFREITSLGSGNLFQPDIILGITDNGQRCTLFKNIETQNQLNFPGIQKATFYSQYLFLGKHFNTANEIRFTSLQANFTNLETWLVASPFSMEIPTNIKNGEWILKYKWPSEFTTQIDNLNCTIESTHEFKTGGDRVKKVLWESKAYLKITPHDRETLEWYWSIIHDLCNFLTLVIGETTYIAQVKAFGDEIEIGADKKTQETIELFFTQKKTSINENIHPFEMLLPLPRFHENIETVLTLWFSKSHYLRSVYDLFFSTFYNPSMYFEFVFLSLIQAIESFHRVTKGGKYLSNEEWKPFKDKLVNAISNELDVSHRESLKSRIKYGNEYSLRKRLKELLSTIDKDILSNLSPTDNYFTGQIVDTRNYLTHYDDELKEQSLEGAHLYWANQRLRILLTIMLLKEIGINDNIIIASMRENNKIRQILNKR